MKHFSKYSQNKNSINIIIMFAFILFTNGSVFGQTVENDIIANATTEISVTKRDNARTTSNMNFVLWFMGSKQDPNNTISNEGINTKKQVITSGTAPNRLLIKAFLKKAINLESMIA
jgi:hypothetical protein